ncbi:HlyD family secretion protein [Terrarubrum flagellatum]|uniref:HlyD family secretion protein n=1 Tax=Terrirubrum flagellatum TaxID=2895980 RepID=UPI0031453F63
MRMTLIACAALVALAGCQRNGDQPQVFGWIEADISFMAPEETGRIVSLKVTEGQRVGAGQPLYTLDDRLERADREAAAATLTQAQAQLARAEAPTQRDEQIKVLQASLSRAEAALKLSTSELERQTNLFKQGWSSKSALDNAQAAYNRDLAGVDEAKRQIQAGVVGGRDEDIEAARQQVAIADARLAAAREREARRTVVASDNGTVEAIYIRAGEMAMSGKPVVSVLGANALKLRFFAPEPVLARFVLGSIVEASCDGCANPVKARINFIAREAEYTPPVIYSREERAKLVFMIEARPEKPEGLRPGMPITVAVPAP